MSAQILNAELTTLFQESKRKNTELRNAAEKSLQDLKALPATSEAQLAADLSRRPYFVEPFLIACGTRNPKYANAALVCLQRLAASRALPKERLRDILEAFKECNNIGTDAQLKILQTLPSLLQNYSEEVRGEILFSVLQICSLLQSTKTAAVNNTATATLQQLISTVFDCVESEDRSATDLPTVAEVPGEDGMLAVRPAAEDAYKVFHDLCLVLESKKPQYVRFSPIPQAFALELVESILTDHAKVFASHSEQGNSLRTSLLPLITRLLSERLSFAITLRVVRVIYVLVRQHLSIVASECEIALSLLNHMLDPDAETPWKRALCVEVFQGIYAAPDLVLHIYSVYDLQDGRKSILGDSLNAFVRLAAEKPGIIGLSNQSTTPMTSASRESPEEQAAVEAGAVAGVISGGMGVAAASVPGISHEWSIPRIACIEQLDKSDPPALPDTYIYALILTCMNNLSESLARFVLPLTIHSDTRKKRKNRIQSEVEQDAPASPVTEASATEPAKDQPSRSQSRRKRSIPINPLSLKHNPAYNSIRTAAAFVTKCWPAVLACCSTFLYAALDADYYRSLIRSFQKFTQVAGLLGLQTPRDALLTTLSKCAVPANMLAANVVSPSTAAPEGSGMFSNPRGVLSVDSFASQGSVFSSERIRGTAVDAGRPSLSTRNLLCLRALLNLAIALGATLESSWAIIFETLQQADIIMAASGLKAATRETRTHDRGRDHAEDGSMASQNASSETAAVQAAASRLFESSVDFSNGPFVQMLKSLCGLLHESTVDTYTSQPSSPLETPKRFHRRVGSYSATVVTNEFHEQDYLLALGKIKEISIINLDRLTFVEPDQSGWNMLVEELHCIAAGSEVSTPARLMAASVLGRVVRNTILSTLTVDDETRKAVRDRSLTALKIPHLQQAFPEQYLSSADESSLRVQEAIIGTLGSIIEQCGDSLELGWNTVFDILLSVFREHDLSLSAVSLFQNPNPHQEAMAQLLSVRLGRVAFASIQLICSDFLSSLPDSSMLPLVNMLFRFCSQKEDLNISLTTLTFFWNVSDFLYNHNVDDLLETLTASKAAFAALTEDIENASRRGSIPATWLHLLLCLTIVTSDDRGEVRNGAVHTLLRIFNICGERFPPEAWELCIRTILLRMLNMNVKMHGNDPQSNKDDHLQARAASRDVVRAWIETTEIMLRGTSGLLAHYMSTLVKAPGFTQSWHSLMELFESYLAFGTYNISAAVFSALSRMLSNASAAEMDGSSLQQVLQIWVDWFPTSDGRVSSESNQDALEAYVGLLREVYRLTSGTLNGRIIDSFIANLQRSVEESDSPGYASDVDTLTPLQVGVMDCLREIRTDIAGVPAALIGVLSTLIQRPFEKPNESSKPRGLTFVALSKASMDHLESLVKGHIHREEVFQTRALLSALTSLATPISLKYKWRPEGKGPTTWQKATFVTLNILASVIEKAKDLSIEADGMKPMWEQIVGIADGIMRADVSAAPPNAPIYDDESVDLSSFSTLRNLITPLLGSPTIPDPVRRSYTASLFQHSLIHRVEPGEIPPPTSSLLQDLYKVRYGRTYDPPPVPRRRMAYSCMGELVTLVAAHDGSTERVKLAQAAAPYLILRAALPLKAYIADQPLRGRMPTPESQRRELLHVLKVMRELESEEMAIPDLDGVKSRRKKHLHRLYPLVCKAVGVAGRDVEVVEELRAVLEVVGEGFGV